MDRLLELKRSADVRSLALARANGWDIEELPERDLDCPKHGTYRGTGQSFGSYDGTKEIWTRCPSCEAEYAAARQREKEEREAAEAQEAMERCRAAAGIPDRFADRNLANFKTDSEGQRAAAQLAREFIENFPAHYKAGSSLVFSGRPGTGKSHLALAILQGVMPRFTGRYLTCMDIVRGVRATWRKDSERSETQVLNSLANYPLLVIDEIGMQYGSEGEQTILFDVLDTRYREMRPTILITNQDKEGFKTYVGERIFDRLTESARWVPFAWESMRKNVRAEVLS